MLAEVTGKAGGGQVGTGIDLILSWGYYSSIDETIRRGIAGMPLYSVLHHMEIGVS